MAKLLKSLKPDVNVCSQPEDLCISIVLFFHTGNFNDRRSFYRKTCAGKWFFFVFCNGGDESYHLDGDEFSCSRVILSSLWKLDTTATLNDCYHCLSCDLLAEHYIYI